MYDNDLEWLEELNLDSDYNYNDGGRSQYFKGKTGDCATRAMAIALELDYKDCYKELAAANFVATGEKTARKGIYKNTLNNVLKKHGWKWNAAPKFQGRKAKYYDMPQGRVIARMSKHFVAVIDCVVWDNWDSTSKMVYGYWSKEQRVA